MKMGRPVERIVFLNADFFDDPKILSLSVHEREQWIRILAEQVKTGNGAELPRHAYGAPRERVERYAELGLLVDVEGRLHINKWDQWNGREAYKRFLARERKRRQRSKSE